MRKLKFTTAILVLILLGNSNQNPSEGEVYITQSECYTSHSGGDYASLNLLYQHGRVEGNLNLYFDGKDNLTGTIQGYFVGDTLFADYTYRLGEGNNYHKNGVAFLKKDGKLYQGHREIISTYVMTDFKRKLPIYFNRGFIFDRTDCK